jgi:histidinol-phosphate aminotransferase
VTAPRLRPLLAELPTYQAARVSASPGGAVHLLGSNESPYGPLPSVVEAIAAASAQVNRYPDYASTELTSELAHRLGTAPEAVVAGCGSVGVAQMLFTAVSEPESDVVYAWRSFEAYPTLAKLAGVRPVAVPLREARHDLGAMAAAITSRTRMVIVCNPNNPTGTALRRAELTGFLDEVPADCLVVLDEAYREYVRDIDVPDGLELAAGRPNVAVLRTFSKAFGLAGLRVGYLVADPALAGLVRKTRLSFSVSHLAQAAAIASLRAEDELMARVDTIVKERERVRNALLEGGWSVPQSEANLVWLPLGDDTAEFATACASAGVNVRAFAGEGVRATIGDPDANDALLAVAAGLRSAR